MKLIINDISELENFANKMAKCLKGNEIILLNGTLAAGKTTFTKFLIKSLNPEMESEVNSPTFNVMNVYDTEKFPVYHIDLYRIKEFDISDLIGNGVIIIEWAEFMDFSDIKEVPVIYINIEILEENKRKLNIETESEEFLNCLSLY
jgi:tRNA threonylcarbamoyladenosine biosynthesis protein TsaE